MPESTQTENPDQIARAGTAIPEGVVGGDSRAHQWARVLRREPFRNSRQRLDRGDHVIRVASVVGDAGYLQGAAGNEISAPAGLTVPAMTAMPAHANSLPRLPIHDLIAANVDDSGHFVSRCPRVGDPRKSI